jgi:hypothetical protein
MCTRTSGQIACSPPAQLPPAAQRSHSPPSRGAAVAVVVVWLSIAGPAALFRPRGAFLSVGRGALVIGRDLCSRVHRRQQQPVRPVQVHVVRCPYQPTRRRPAGQTVSRRAHIAAAIDTSRCGPSLQAGCHQACMITRCDIGFLSEICPTPSDLPGRPAPLNNACNRFDLSGRTAYRCCVHAGTICTAQTEDEPRVTVVRRLLGSPP